MIQPRFFKSKSKMLIIRIVSIIICRWNARKLHELIRFLNWFLFNLKCITNNSYRIRDLSLRLYNCWSKTKSKFQRVQFHSSYFIQYGSFWLGMDHFLFSCCKMIYFIITSSIDSIQFEFFCFFLCAEFVALFYVWFTSTIEICNTWVNKTLKVQSKAK